MGWQEQWFGKGKTVAPLNLVTSDSLFNKFFGFEKFAQVKDLPGGQTNQATQGEQGKIQHS